jgi:hypothetical protein
VEAPNGQPAVAVDTLNLPAGSFVISASVNAFSLVGPWQVTCTLAAAGLTLDSRSGILSNNFLSSLTVQGWIQLSTPGTVTLACLSFGVDASTIGAAVGFSDAKFSALQAGTLTAL